MNHKHTYDRIPCLLCARQSFVLTQTRQQHHHHHRNHHRHTTPEAQQQHSSRDSCRGGGDLMSPATMYVPDFQKQRQTAKQDLPIQNKTTFQQSKAVMDAPYFSCTYFWSFKHRKIIARNNRSKIIHNSRSENLAKFRFPTRFRLGRKSLKPKRSCSRWNTARTPSRN